jgi:hypothetical protein
MKRRGFTFCSLLCAALLTAAAATAQLPAYTQAGPIPQAILSAKTIFVSNAGSDSGLFPSPFSGDANRTYTQFYTALKVANQFALATDPSDADLVLELQLIAPNGPTEGSKAKGASDPLPMFRLTIYDRKTHYILWTITQSIDPAVGQKNHDHTFDAAIQVLLEKFQQLTGKPVTPSH